MTRVSDGVDRVPLLLSESADQEFREQGFTVVPLVDPERLEALRERMSELIPPDSGPFFTLYKHDTPELRRTIDAAVRKELQPFADSIMCNHRFYVGSLWVKSPGEGSPIDAHQDWSFVDETRHVSGALWFPLEATDESNGGLSVVPGSHRLDLPYRGTPPTSIEQYLHGFVNVTTKPGEAVIFHNALIHSSSENQSDHLRIVMALGFVSETADFLYFFTDEQGQKWRYRLADDFPFTHQPPHRPNGPSVLAAEPWPS
jgi:phytanoyl-CoA hydroxylase